MLLTEGNWVMPNAYAAEGPFLVAAYASLSGVDAYYWFSTEDEGWTAPQSANGYLPSQGKWLFATPEMLGSFPAAALAYRQGYIRRGTPVVVENRALADLWERKTPVITEAPSFDPNRDAGDIAKDSNIKTGISPDAFLVGPVQVAFEKDPSKSLNILSEKQVRPGYILSNTGELVLNSTLGFSTINTPMVQAVAAHFKNAPVHQLQDVRFASDNTFGAAFAVSLDGAPLKMSKRILLQYATQSRPTGWQDAPTTITLADGQKVNGFEVVSFGSAPWQVSQARLEVTVDNLSLRSATVLDMNGMAVHTLALDRLAKGARLRFPANTMYVILQ